MLANGGVLALTFLVGWVGFASLEEMHFRGHLLQLHAEWKHHLSEVEAALDAEQIARTVRQDETVHELAVRKTLARLADDSPYPGISVSAAGVRDVRNRYAASPQPPDCRLRRAPCATRQSAMRSGRRARR